MRKINLYAAGALVGMYAAAPAWALDIADVPLFQSTYVPPNVMLFVDNSTSMASYGLNGEAASAENPSRLDVAKILARDLVDANLKMRIGLSVFDCEDGFCAGEVDKRVRGLSALGALTQADADSNLLDLRTAISGVGVPTVTTVVGEAPPDDTAFSLARGYYEVDRYFRGMTKTLSPEDVYTSPIQYRCQKNFGVVLTDSLPADQLGAGTPMDLDGIASADWGSVGFDAAALFAKNKDLKDSGNDNYGVSYEQLPFEHQNIKTYTVDLTGGATGETLPYWKQYSAANADQVSAGLSAAMLDVRGQTSSAAAIATNSTRLDTETLIYQARFNSSDWTGEVIAYNLNADGSVGNAYWKTSQSGKIPAAGFRNIFTYNETTTAGVQFLWSDLSTSQQASLSIQGLDTAADGQARLNWLRGASDGALLSHGERLRTRVSVLGDIINSDPLFVGAQSFGYTVPDTLANTSEPADSYLAYLQAKNSRTKLLMVGANDGMVHGLNAQTGEELFAYVPSSLYKPRTTLPGDTPGLISLTKADYTHKYFADGSLAMGDVYVGSNWKTYVAGGLGAGGRGIFALDVTNPAGFSASDVRWEITAPDTNDTTNAWNDLGYTYGAPVITRLQDGTWVVIFGNGYDSNTQKAALYVVSATTGALIQKIVVNDPQDSTTPLPANGLGAPAVMVNANRMVTHVYAGDLRGNLWRFDLSGLTSTNQAGNVTYKTSNAGTALSAPLFTASKDGVRQPITGGLEVGVHANGGWMIYFGTGKYFENADNIIPATPPVESFYGIRDKYAECTSGSCRSDTVTRSSLVAQTIDQQKVVSNTNVRVVSTNAVDWDTKRGWYMDLKLASGTANGERSVSLPLLKAGRIIFTTVVPSADPCLAGGTSWLMELDALTGARLPYAVLDINGDGEFSEDEAEISGRQSDEGIIRTPGIVSAGEVEYKYAGASSGNILVVKEKGSRKEGRMSWRQLR